MLFKNQVCYNINFNDQIQVQQMQRLIALAIQSHVRGRNIEIIPNQDIQIRNKQFRLVFDANKPEFDDYRHIMKQMHFDQQNVNFIKNMEIDICLETTPQRFKIFQSVIESAEDLISSITKLKIDIQSDIEQRVFEQLIILFSSMRKVEHFTFICRRKFRFQDPIIMEQFISSFKNILATTRVMIFSNEQCQQKGYQEKFLSEFPALFSKAIKSAKNLEVLQCSLAYAGFQVKRNSVLFSSFLTGIYQYMRFWPSNIQKLSIDYNRLICFNINISNEHINCFLNELIILISRLTFLKEFSLNLCGIGYEGGTKQKEFPQLSTLVSQLSQVNILELDVLKYIYYHKRLQVM